MKLCYILIFTIITNIYSALPGKCHTDADPTKSVIPCTSSSTECSGTTGDTPTKFIQDGLCYNYIAHCEQYNPSYDACYKCAEGYVFSSGHKCVTPVTLCSANSIGDDGKCTACDNHYTVKASDGTCECGTSKKVVDGLCVPDVANCEKYGVVSGSMECTKCRNGFKLASGTSCTQCEDGKTNNGGSENCFTAKENCVTHANDGKCIKCNANLYAQSDGSCAACGSDDGKIGGSFCHGTSFTLVDNCIEYEGADGNCIKCGNHIGLDAANKCDNTNNVCYYPEVSDGTACYIPVENCASRTGNTCITCNSGYHLSSVNTCIKDCETCTPETKPSTEASNASSMKLNIIFMAIIMMFIA